MNGKIKNFGRLAFVALLLVSTITAGLGGGPIGQAQAQTTGDDEASPYIAGGPLWPVYELAFEEEDANGLTHDQIRHEQRADAHGISTSGESSMTTFYNMVHLTRHEARLQAKKAIVASFEEGNNAGAAHAAGEDAIDEYYATYEGNVLQNYQMESEKYCQMQRVSALSLGYTKEDEDGNQVADLNAFWNRYTADDTDQTLNPRDTGYSFFVNAQLSNTKGDFSSGESDYGTSTVICHEQTYQLADGEQMEISQIYPQDLQNSRWSGVARLDVTATESNTDYSSIDYTYANYYDEDGVDYSKRYYNGGRSPDNEHADAYTEYEYDALDSDERNRISPVVSVNRYKHAYQTVHHHRTAVKEQLSMNYVENLHTAYENGEIDSSDVYTWTEFQQMSMDESDVGTQTWTLLEYYRLGFDGLAADQQAVLEMEDGTEKQGVLVTQNQPQTTNENGEAVWQVNETYALSDYENPFILVQDNGEAVELQQDFTITSLYDVDSGEEIDEAGHKDRSVEDFNSDDFVDKMDEIESAIADLEKRQEVNNEFTFPTDGTILDPDTWGGGDGLGGLIPDWLQYGIAAVVLLLAVAVGTLGLTAVKNSPPFSFIFK